MDSCALEPAQIPTISGNDAVLPEASPCGAGAGRYSDTQELQGKVQFPTQDRARAAVASAVLGNSNLTVIAKDRPDSPGPDVRLDDFEVVDGDAGRSLGKGSFGVVRRIRRKGTCDVFALKTMQKIEVIEGELIDQVEREIQVQRNLKHDNVLRLYRHFEDAETVYLLLEYCAKGELYQLLRSRKGRRFPEPVAKHYFMQVVSGLRYLHSQSIVHRDLKPENLLVNHNDVLKIADFGWCAFATTVRTTFCGTLDYLAPEMIQGRGHDHTLDTWSLGVLLYEMVVGRPPFQSTNHVMLIAKILSAELRFPAFVPAEVSDLVTRLLQKEPPERLPLDRVLKHVWLLDGDRSQILGQSTLSNCPVLDAIAQQAHSVGQAVHAAGPTANTLTNVEPGLAGGMHELSRSTGQHIIASPPLHSKVVALESSSHLLASPVSQTRRILPQVGVAQTVTVAQKYSPPSTVPQTCFRGVVGTNASACQVPVTNTGTMPGFKVSGATVGTTWVAPATLVAQSCNGRSARAPSRSAEPVAHSHRTVSAAAHLPRSPPPEFRGTTSPPLPDNPDPEFKFRPLPQQTPREAVMQSTSHTQAQVRVHPSPVRQHRQIVELASSPASAATVPTNGKQHRRSVVEVANQMRVHTPGPPPITVARSGPGGHPMVHMYPTAAQSHARGGRSLSPVPISVTVSAGAGYPSGAPGTYTRTVANPVTCVVQSFAR